MELYKRGKVVSVGKSYVIFETNFVGSIIYVPNVEIFKEDEKLKLFVYKYQTEYSTAVYGFKTFKERLLFEDLISLNGIGPKTAIGLLKEGKDMLINMLANADVEGLASFPYLGIKTANQIVFELSDKYKNMQAKDGVGKSNMILPISAKDSLKTLGFNQKQIDYAIKTIKPQPKIELLVEEAIKAISNAKFT